MIEEKVQMRKNSANNNARPVSIVDRLSKLQTAQNSWHNKVETKDVKQFTVAGKMQRDNNMLNIPMTSPAKPRPKSPTPTPSAETPKLRSVTGKTATRPASAFVLPSPAASEFNARSISMIEESGQTVEVPELDSDLNTFFPTLETVEFSNAKLDLDEIPMLESSLLTMPKRASNRLRPASKNPVKQLAQRTDLRASYTEVVTNVAEREVTRINVEKVERTSNRHAHLAVEALAGLASKEDFSNLKLSGCAVLPNQELQPYKKLMLLLVKGRRFCQTRLVAPSMDSINSGDAYVLVTPKEVINWQGKYANVIERSRSAEIAASIVQKKDLGCRSMMARVFTIEEEKSFGSSRAEKAFWSRLGETAKPQPREAGPPEEDENFEADMAALNMVWDVQINEDEKESLVPLESAWGSVLKHDILEPLKVLVFDFGSEAYVWSGKAAPFELRTAGANLVKQIWDEGFDNSNLILGTQKGSRPEWGLVGKVTQHMETTAFREKFMDWPDATKTIRVKEDEEKMARAVIQSTGEIEIFPFDAREMASWTIEDPNLQLEGSYLGRGTGYYDTEERRQYEVDTLGVKCWHVNEYKIEELPSSWPAQFHSEDSYVFRWTYKVSLTGRDLKGRPSKHMAVGRDRCAYYFWQGRRSKVTEKGASALMTVELDREEGPQIRVDQGREDAAFLNLWEGKMCLHRGRRGVKRGREKRLFIVRGEAKNEAFGVEVECESTSLRSLGSFVLLDKAGRTFLWHGSSSPSHTREVAKSFVDKMLAESPIEFGFADRNLTEEFEGCESSDFKRALSGSAYFTSRPPPEISPKLFYMTAVSGSFEVTQVVCPFRKVDVLNPLAFNQEDLYEKEQPALFLLDTGDKLWLWQGWFPASPDPESNDNNITGSGLIRWHAERRAAMQTAVEYRNASHKKRSPMELVWAGHEGLEFTSLFPSWTAHSDVAELNKEVRNIFISFYFILL